MNRRLFLASAAALAAGPALAADPAPASLVLQADILRLPDAGGALKMTMSMTDGEGARRETDRVSVITRDDKSLVQMLDGGQRGMKVLSSPQALWIYMPNTRRAMRITPLQRMRGQANVGDIARLSFSADYNAVYAPQPSLTVEGKECWALVLTAKSPAATYTTVHLRIAKATGAPVSADMLAASGRRLKTVLYGAPVTVSGRRMIATTTYVDGVNPGLRTTVQMLSIERSNAPAGMFRPEALPTDF